MKLRGNIRKLELNCDSCLTEHMYEVSCGLMNQETNKVGTFHAVNDLFICLHLMHIITHTLKCMQVREMFTSQ